MEGDEQETRTASLAEPETRVSDASLVRELSEELRRLVRDEMELARRELGRKARASALATVCLGLTAVLGVFFLACVIATIILLFVAGGPWLPTICTAGVLFGLMGAFGGAGLLILRMASPLVPRQTIESLRDDVDTVRKGVAG